VFVVHLGGDWSIKAHFPTAASVMPSLAAATVVRFDCTGLGRCDSSLPAFLLELYRLCSAQGRTLDSEALPDEVASLLALAVARPKRAEVPAATQLAPIATLGEPGHVEDRVAYRVGVCVVSCGKSWNKALDFIGQVVIALGKFVCGRARTRFGECWQLIRACGPDALPIISLVSFLTGIILAYLGMLQMRQIGATTFVPGFVSLTMMREMGVLMAGVILCGRTATAYAAQLGNMQVTEEVAAFRVLGISPVEYLVLPRIIALLCVMPLLTLYANFFGVIGGVVVISNMGVSVEQCYDLIVRTVTPHNLASGLFKSVVFALLIAWAGCFRGMVSGKSSQAVGNAATSAAVLGITLLVIADAVFAVIYNVTNFF
jgi:phospholipid/cholesterol/gamma-HCH transport system permease protein